MVPSPLGHKPVNAVLPADATSVTDTSGAGPFCTWTWMTKPAARPALTLDRDGRTLRHRSTGRLAGDTEGDGEAVAVAVTAGSGRHCVPALEATAVDT